LINVDTASNPSLVGGIPTPPVNGKDDIPYIMENKKCLKPPTSSKSFDSSDMVGEMAYPSYKGEYAWFIWCIMVGLRMGSPSSAVACYGRGFHLSKRWRKPNSWQW
jgi:hypothetical protein